MTVVTTEADNCAYQEFMTELKMYPAITQAEIGKEAFAAHRLLGQREGLEMAAAHIQANYPNDKRVLVPAIRKLGGGND